MKKIAAYLRAYFTTLDKRIFFLSSLFIAAFIFINYHYRLNRQIGMLRNGEQYLCWFVIFFVAFSFAYLLFFFFGERNAFRNPSFIALLFLAPLIFSWKMVFDVEPFHSSLPERDQYWNAVVYWPFKLLVVSAVLYLLWRQQKQPASFYGTTFRGFSLRPYLLMLLIMLPLIAMASTQHDFLAMYPKMKKIAFLSHNSGGFYKLLYELAYGSDFFTIELFFRGFLILAFSKWFGKAAILPMACFYCTIHFGKPIGECISSYFGGIILGVVTYHTRSIFGGLMVHLGIAWMMELGGYLGGIYFPG